MPPVMLCHAPIQYTSAPVNEFLEGFFANCTILLTLPKSYALFIPKYCLTLPRPPVSPIAYPVNPRTASPSSSCLVPSVNWFRNDSISSEAIEPSSRAPNWLSNLDRMNSYGRMLFFFRVRPVVLQTIVDGLCHCHDTPPDSWGSQNLDQYLDKLYDIIYKSSIKSFDSSVAIMARHH